LGLVVLDTGATYRAVALLAIEQDAADDLAWVSRIASEASFDLSNGNVLVNGRDVTTEIRSLEVGQWASRLSVHAEVRRSLVAQQRELARTGGFVLEGRDVTTVVATDADVKIFLTASIEERARRRWLELRLAEPELRLQVVVRDVVERDHRDYTRDESPLTLAEDAHIVETYGQSPDEVADVIARLAMNR